MINYSSLSRVCFLAAFVLMLQVSWNTYGRAAGAPAETTLYLKSLKFVGNDLVATKDLKNQLTMTLPSIWPWKKLPPFKAGELERDVGRLKAYYRQQGFFHTRIRPSLKKLAQERVAVVVHIKEGPWIKVSRINLDVAPTERPVNLQQLEEKRPVKVGDRLIASHYEDLKRLYLNHLLNHGYPHAVVDGKVYVNEKLNTAKIDLQVNPGVFSHFGPVTVSGNRETPDYLILRQLTFKKGDVFNFEEIYASQRNLYKLDLFSSVALVPEKVSPKERIIPIAIKAQEKKKRAVKFGVGYGDEDKLRLRGALRLRNVGGGGRTFDLEGKYSSIDSHFTSTFTNPQIWASYFDLIVSGGGLYLQYPNFNDTAIFVQARLERKLPWKFRGYAGYQLQQDRPTDIPGSTELAFSEPQERRFRTAMAFLGLNQDTTDNELYPSRGGTLSARGESSLHNLGADLQFLRTILEARRYFNLYEKKLILAARFKIGMMGPIEDTREIPLFRRFFCGGYNSVRGYRLYYLGPRDIAGDPIGGDALMEGSGELRFPIYKELRGVAFLDFGNVYPKIHNLDPGQFKYAAGAGLRYRTPIGPVGIDLAFPLNPIDPGSDKFQIHFTIGQAF
ncbi:MAG: autotransporter assembly complex protein TamA [Thermodesulfobacteriota bacterium]